MVSLKSRIAVFCYDFPHYKTNEGLKKLKEAGFENVSCFAAPYKQLNIVPSKIKIGPLPSQEHPENVAFKLKYHYTKIDHDHPALPNIIKYQTAGVILGAKTLKQTSTWDLRNITKLTNG